MLTAITKRSEVRAALKRFHTAFKQTTSTTWRPLGMQGHTTQDYKFYWHPEPGIWAVLDESQEGNRSWNCFGTSDPYDGSGTIAISCEINIPHEGMNRQIAGVFARDDTGEYIAHTGKIGGGRPGISKTNFVRTLGASHVRREVSWPGVRIPMECILISELNDPNLVKHVYRFVRAVETFKEGETPERETDAGAFTPEFSGDRAPYTLSAEINARCDHGHIVNELAAQLEAQLVPPLKVRNDLYTDLILTKGRSTLALFEVKSSASLTDIYTAIGQLMYHTADRRPPPAHVAVLPDALPADALARLKRLGLHVCTYRWERGKPVFPNLPRLLPHLLQD